MTPAAFKSGDRVEVCSNEDGYQGSYFGAKVLSRKDNDSYVVQYDNLVEESDQNTPLQEVISANEIRPMPPKSFPVTAYGGLTKVDAFDKDGWWVGEITGRTESKFLVYFDLYRVEIPYSITQLRPHQEFIKGHWVISSKNLYRGAY
ncbi:hypothetical protein ACFE04_000680 [Oxalis oulophora]